MKISYVVSTMVFWWREHHLSLELECDFLKSLGYGVEIWPTIRGHSECRFIKRNWDRLKDATEDMQVVLHGRVDGPTIDDWQEQILCAKHLNAALSTHLESLCVSDTLGIADWDFAGEVVAFAKENNVELCVETGKLDMMEKVGEKFDSVKYCFNTGHAALNDDAKFNDYVDKLAERIRIVHLTDNHGEIDDHQPPGLAEGIKPECWNYLLESLKKYDNEVIGAFEMFPAMPDIMIKHAGKFLFDKMGWPNPPQKESGHEERHYRPF